MKITHSILFCVLWLSSFSLLGMEWEMEASSSKPYYAHDFQEGIATLLSDIDQEDYDDYNEHTPLLAKSSNQPKPRTPISKETKELMERFLNLPREIIAYIVPFLDNAALAYFIHLKYLTKETVNQSSNKLALYHVKCLIKGIKEQTLPKEKLLRRALQFGRKLKQPSPYFNDLQLLHACLRCWLINEYGCAKILDDYQDNTLTPPSLIEENISKVDYCLLRQELLERLYRYVMQRKYRSNLVINCIATSRYCVPLEQACASSMCCLSTILGCIASKPILVPLLCTCILCSTTVGILACCCSPNICFKMPELPLIQKCIPSLEGDNICGTSFSRLAMPSPSFNDFSIILQMIGLTRENIKQSAHNLDF